MRQHDSNLSRRSVLAGGFAALALGGCGSDSLTGLAEAPSGGSSSAASAPPLATAEAASWIAAAGTTFLVGGQSMRLAGVELMGPAGGRPSELRQQAFIAAFDVLDGAPMREAFYTISHPSIPTFDIHLVNSSASPWRMHALFN